ncbi:MAG: response regulator transcription factor [Ignavibacteriales bacterium]|nr:response regulator transcription factor [Ignavibacteriales bacterium]
MEQTNNKESVPIVIADDHPVFRKGLCDIVAAEKSLIVVGETGDGNQVLKLVHELKPLVLLLDLNMPGSNGLDIAASLQDENFPVRIIVLTMHKEEGIFNKAMDHGVRGYVLKESAVNDILQSIKSVINDEYYISPAISKYLLNRRGKTESILLENPGLAQLTPNERKILKLISENKSSKEIADQMFISIRTVENHRMNICNKLAIHGSNALLKFAIENKSYL